MKQFRQLFSLSLIAVLHYQAVSQCTGTQSHTTTPAPVNNEYLCGTVVTFCYTMQNYTQVGSNWIHGFDINLGPGWDISTLTPTTIPNSCDNDGNWDFYNTWTSTNTNQTFGPGFAYDSPNGSPFFTLDGIPGNNYGDNCTNFTWTLCFSVQVALGSNGQSLSVDVKPIGDGTSGSWSNTSCPGSYYNLTNAISTCCQWDVTTSTVQPTCANNNGEIITTPNGGVAPYTFSWNTGQTDSALTGLPAGTYIVSVTDSFGCIVIDTATLGFTNPVTISTTSTNVSCNSICDGTATATGANGLAPYSYVWLPGFQTTSTINGLCAGTYYVSVTDANQCSRSDTVIITEPPVLSATWSIIEDATCFGGFDGSAWVSASGGTPGYSYLWTPGNQTNDTATGLTTSTYQVDVTDANGCETTVYVIVGSPPALQLTPTAQNVSCFGFSDGSISVTVSQGVAPYSYSWNYAGNTTNALSNIPAGEYVLTVTDANGCIEIDTFLITEPELLSGTIEVTDASCLIASDGELEVFISGGTQPYSYVWSNTSVSNSLNSNLPTGNYSVDVTDANGCTIQFSGFVAYNPDFTVFAGYDTSITLGSVIILAADVSEAGDYFFTWSPAYNITDVNSQTPFVFPYYDTTYIVYVEEEFTGCNASDTININILPTSFVMAPNAFTPNNDGLNDLFYPVVGETIAITEFKIFNRWGVLIHADAVKPWDGRSQGIEAEVGTYIYSIGYTDSGETVPVPHFISGNVILIR